MKVLELVVHFRILAGPIWKGLRIRQGKVVRKGANGESGQAPASQREKIISDMEGKGKENCPFIANGKITGTG